MKWVSVEDGLPAESGDVLVWLAEDGGTVDTAIFEPWEVAGYKFQSPSGVFVQPTHWMPLPPAPGEGVKASDERCPVGDLTTAQILDAFHHLDFLEAELALATCDTDREVIDRDIGALLAELADELVDKVDALAYVVDRAEAEAKLAKVHEQRAADRRRRAARVASRCKERIHMLVAEAVKQGVGQTTKAGTRYVDTGRVRCSVQLGNPGVVGPERVEDWPEQWTTTVTDKSKARALKALKALPDDQWPDGFAIVRRPSVRIKA